LFQKPYFELLNGALREGGVITTQGCSWPFIISCYSIFFFFCSFFSTFFIFVSSSINESTS
jgi:spermidine synthase